MSSFEKTFADNLLTPHVIQDVHVILSSVEKKVRFLMKTFQDFLHIMDFNGNQTVQSPNESFSAASKGFERHQTMNKGLIKQKNGSFNK